jgi:hypothetical protein
LASTSERARGAAAILAGLCFLLPAASLARGVGSIEGEVALARLSVGSQLRDPDQVVVYLEDGPKGGPLPKGPFVIGQQDKKFVPSQLIVPVGAAVGFVNGDRLDHNVFSPAPGSAFDLGIYQKGAVRRIIFDKPGVVPIYCNMHPQMVAYVLAVDNSYFVRPGPDGRFRFTGLPAGNYHLVAWSPYSAPVRETVRVQDTGAARLSLVVRERGGAERHADKTGKAYQPYASGSADAR